MSAPGVSRISPLRCAGALAVCFVAGAGMQTLIQRDLSTSGSQASTGTSGLAPSPSATPVRAAMPTRESLAALSPEEQLTALAAALPQMEIADILPLVEHLLKAQRLAPVAPPADPFAAPPPDLVSPLLRALFTRWAALDATGMMAFTESGPLRYDYDTRRLAVLALVEVRGLSALEEVRAKSPSLAGEAAREMLIRQPAQLEALLPFLEFTPPYKSYDGRNQFESDEEEELLKGIGPELYLRYAMEMGEPDAIEQTLRLLTSISPDHALKSIKALPSGPRRDQILSTWLLSRVPEWDPLTDKENDCTFFRREYEAMAEGPAKSALNSRYATLRALENPDAAMKWAQSLPDARQRFEAVTSICASLFMGTDTGNTFLGFYGREGDGAERLTRQFAGAWMAAPQESAKAFKRNGASAYAVYPFVEWHIKDPAASEAWLATVPNPELRKSLAESVTLPAAVLLKFVTDSSSRLEFASSALFDAKTGPESFDPNNPEDFATIPKEWRDAARLYHLEKNPPTLADWNALTPGQRWHLTESMLRRSATHGVPETLSADPFAAPGPEGENKDWLTFFNSIPSAERSLGAYYAAGAAYITSDEAAASEWMESLPPGAERDAAATALVEHLVNPGDSQDGEAAFAWAAAMSGETERARYTAEAIRAWAAEDPAAARTAVEASALPAAEKSALLQKLPTEGGAR